MCVSVYASVGVSVSACVSALVCMGIFLPSGVVCDLEVLEAAATASANLTWGVMVVKVGGWWWVWVCLGV